MKSSLKTLLLVSGLALLLSPFNNCGEYSDSSLFQSSEVPEDCTEPSNCLVPDSKLMKMSTSTGDVYVFEAQRYLNVGGICHDGNHDFNRIIYELKDNGNRVHRYTANSIENCVNGRFKASIDLQNLSDTGLDYTGAFPNGVHQNLVLSATLYGVNSRGESIQGTSPAAAFFIKRINAGP